MLCLISRRLQVFRASTSDGTFNFSESLPIVRMTVRVPNKVANYRSSQSRGILTHVHFSACSFPIPSSRNVRSYLRVSLPAATSGLFTSVLSRTQRLIHASVQVNIHRGQDTHPRLTGSVRGLISQASFLTTNMGFTIEVNANSPFARAVIKLSIRLVLATSRDSVLFAFTRILSAFSRSQA